jgi:hypothetical protein
MHAYHLQQCNYSVDVVAPPFVAGESMARQPETSSRFRGADSPTPLVTPTPIPSMYIGGEPRLPPATMPTGDLHALARRRASGQK